MEDDEWEEVNVLNGVDVIDWVIIEEERWKVRSLVRF